MDDLSELTDAALLHAAATSSDAFGTFYDRHAQAVLRFLYRRTDCAETAADLCAETFAAAFVQRRRFRDTGTTARPWLYGIAKNLLGHYLRRQRVSERYRRRIGAGVVALDDEELLRVRHEIRAAIEQLPEGTADAVVLRIGHDLPYPEVATRLGCSEGAARVRVSRGLARLADLLEER